MSNLSKLEFICLDVSGKNYMSWSSDVEIHLESMELSHVLDENTVDLSPKDKARALIFIRKHIDEGLKYEYLTEKNPIKLWKSLKDRYGHQKEVFLPIARDEWNSLRFQDFKRVPEYYSAIQRIVAQLKFCGQEVTDGEMLEKTLSTFHASDVTLQQQYRIQKYKKFSDLMTTLTMAENQNQLLMKNHQSRPTGSTVLPEANVAVFGNPERGYNFGRGRGRGYGYGRGRGRGRRHHNSNNFSRPDGIQKKHHENKTAKQVVGESSTRNHEDSCYRCGAKGHWSRACRTPEHLCKLYKESLKGKGKEVNFTEPNDLDDDYAHLEANDFTDEFPEKEFGDN